MKDIIVYEEMNAEFQKAQEEIQKAQEEFKETLNQAKEDVMEHVMKATHFSYESIEEIMGGYGLEMDYIEDFLI
jgi:Skp family chaperone for outer membrane proteins